MIRNILLALSCNQSIFYYLLSRDLFKNKQNFKEEPGDMRLLALTSIYHLLSFNIWRFRLCYRKRPLSKVEMGQHEKNYPER